MNHDAETEALRRALRGLPEEAPPPSVWLSLQVRHALEFRQPRPQRWRIAAAAAVLLAAPLLVWRMPGPDRSPPGLGPELIELRAIDRELQLRYLDGASDEELAPLWRRRADLLQPRATPSPAPVTLSI